MIDVVGPAVEPVLTHHGAEVMPILQLLAAGGFGVSMMLLAIRGSISGIAARGRSAAKRGPEVGGKAPE